MSDSPGQFPVPDDADAAVKPRPVASRHYRGPAPDSPGGAGPQPEAARADPPVAADPAAKVRRAPLQRSGHLNMAALVGDAAQPDDSPASIHGPAAPQIILPAGLGGLAWKLGLVALVMFGLGYLVSQYLHPPPPRPAVAAEPARPAVWQRTSLEILQRAATADRAGDLKTAAALLTELTANQPGLPGATRYLADVLIRQSNHINAETLLLAQANAGRELAQTQYLRAFNAARQRHFEDAARYLELSLAQDPFSADAYYQLGEVLRRQGKWADAIESHRRALLRVRSAYGISPATIGLKLRLAQIEAGQSAEVEAALAEVRKTPPLAAEWLLTAAALALQKGDWPAAAESLGKAREMMPREEFDAWVDDYFFRAHTGRPELSAFRPSDEDRRRRQEASWDFSLDP